jgi:cytochrome c
MKAHGITRTILALSFCAAGALMAGSAAAEGDAAAGEKVFNKCKTCHTLEAGQNKIGPSLAGVIGRAAGTAEGFAYSDAMKASGVTWTEENLAAYLAKPKDFIPGNKMTFAGLKKEADIANVIAYIKQAGGQ